MFVPHDDLVVLPGKTYSLDFCILKDTFGDATANITNTSGLIADIRVDEFAPLNGTTYYKKCSIMHIDIAEYKTDKGENLTEKFYVYGSTGIEGTSVMVSKEIKIDASEISYKNVLLAFSWKLVLVFISILAVSSSLLYIIRKIQKNE
jgi:hypothetical protein